MYFYFHIFILKSNKIRKAVYLKFYLKRARQDPDKNKLSLPASPLRVVRGDLMETCEDLA
jgi:hypothetical protein